MKTVNVSELKNGDKFVNSKGEEFLYIGRNPITGYFIATPNVGMYKVEQFLSYEMFRAPKTITGYVLIYQNEYGEYKFGKDVYSESEYPYVDECVKCNKNVVKVVTITHTID